VFRKLRGKPENERRGFIAGGGCMLFLPRLPPSRMSLEFGESQTYPCTGDGSVGVFLPVTAPRPDGVHVDLNVDYTASESPNLRRAVIS
jgi:hypothetical protein